MTRHPLPYLVIALLVLVGSSIAAPSSGRGLPPAVIAQSGAPHERDARFARDPREASAPARHDGGAPPRTAGEPIAEPSGAVTSAFGDAASVTVQGILGYAKASYGPDYLAIPERRGTIVTICGPAACLERVSSDFGPDQRVHPGRIADVAEVDFPVLCGVPISRGLCPGSYTITRGGPRLTAPPTDGGQP